MGNYVNLVKSLKKKTIKNQWKGVVTISNVKADFSKSKFAVLSKNPFFIIQKQKGSRQKSSICSNKIKPQWPQTIQFIKTSVQIDIYRIYFLSQSIFGKNFLGQTCFSLSNIKKGASDSFKCIFIQQVQLHNKGKFAGICQFKCKLKQESPGHPQILTPSTSGRVTCKIFKTIFKNKPVFSKFNPFFRIKLGLDQHQSSIKQSSQKTIYWTQQFRFTKKDKQDSIILLFYNQLSQKEYFLGASFISLTPCFVNNIVYKGKSQIYYQEKLQGNIQFELTFETYQPQKYKQAQISLNFLINSLTQSNQSQVQNKELIKYFKQFQNSNITIDRPQDGINVQYTYKNGDKYIGCIKNGKRQGKGKMFFSNQSYYEGQWKDNQYNGYGILKENNYKYQGQFKQGKKNGKGKMILNNGNIYNGQFKNNMKHGVGILILLGVEIQVIYDNGQRLLFELQQKPILNEQQIIKSQKNLYNFFNQIKQKKTISENSLHSLIIPINFDIKQLGMLNGFFLTTGNILYSYPRRNFFIILNNNGSILVINNINQQVHQVISKESRQLFFPYFLKLQMDGVLNLWDSKGIYYSWNSQYLKKVNGPFVLNVSQQGIVSVLSQQGILYYVN